MKRHLCTLILLGSAAACVPSPYTKAAGNYGAAVEESATALAAVPNVMSRSCWNLANVAYLQSRLLRFDLESKGVGGGTQHEFVTFNDFLDKAEALPTVSYRKYCSELEETSAAFSAGVGALAAYGKALEALAKTGSYDGADIQTIVKGVGTIAQKVSGGSDSAKTVGVIASGLSELAKVIVAAKVESDLKGYVAESEPTVKALVDALEKYLDAVANELQVIETHQETLIGSAEALGGMGAAKEALPACAVLKSPPTPALSDPSLDRRLAAVCETLALVKRHSDGALALSFYGFAIDTAQEVKETRRIRSGFKEILGSLRETHAALVQAKEGPEELKTALGHLIDLFTQLKSLEAALSGKE